MLRIKGKIVGMQTGLIRIRTMVDPGRARWDVKWAGRAEQSTARGPAQPVLRWPGPVWHGPPAPPSKWVGPSGPPGTIGLAG